MWEQTVITRDSIITILEAVCLILALKINKKKVYTTYKACL